MLEELDRTANLPSGMAAHVAECQECAALLRERRKLETLLGSEPGPAMSSSDWADIEQNIMQAVSAPKAEVPVRVRRFHLYRPLLAAAALLLITFAAYFQFHSRTALTASPTPVTVSYIQGSAVLSRNAEGSGEVIRVVSDFPAREMPVIAAGTKIETPDSAALGFRIATLAEVAVAEHSRMQVNSLEPADTRLKLDEGTLTVHVDPAVRKGPFTVETDNAFCLVTGTIFTVSVSDSMGEKRTRLYVEKGCVRFVARSNGSDTMSVHAGKQAIVSDRSISPVSEAAAASSEKPLERFEPVVQVKESIGYLHVVTVPLACSLFVEGRTLGISPLFIACKPGPMSVTVAQKGFETNQEPVVVRAGQSSRLLVILRESPLAGRESESVEPVVKQAVQAAAPALTPPSGTTAAEPGPAVDTLSELYQNARRLITAGKFQEALPVLRKCSPDNVVCRMWLSRCLEELGRYDEALAVMSAMVADPSVPRVMRDNAKYGLIGLYMNGKKDPRMALACTESYLGEFPDGSWAEEALYEKGRLLQVFDRYGEAAATLESYCLRFPEGPRLEKALHEAGTLRLHRLNDAAGALKDFDRLLKNGGRSYAEEALFWKAQALFSLGKTVDALDSYRRYQQLYPAGRYVSTCNERIKSLYTGK